MRKTVLAAALLFGLIAPAAAQAPPPVPALPDAQRLATYSLTASNCACSVGFQIYGSGSDVDEWISVYVNGVAKLSTDPTFGWALTSATGPLASIPRPITNAVLTFNSVQTAGIIVVGNERPRRLSQFSENRGVPARDLNQVFTDAVAVQRELWDKSNRSIVGQPGEVFSPLPPAASRIGNLLGFDSFGNPAVVLASDPSAAILATMPPFTTICNPTGLVAVAQPCPAITAVAPLGISGTTINVNTLATNGQFFAGSGNPTNTGGASNIGVGQNALFGLTSGTGNVAIGSTAAAAISSGSNNFALGTNSLLLLTTAAGNVAIGTNTLESNIIGAGNVAVGDNSLPAATGGFNTGVGQQTGTNLTSGAANLFLGTSAGGGITTGGNNVILGSCIGLAAASASTMQFCTGNTTLHLDLGRTTSGVWTFVEPVASKGGINPASDANGALTNSPRLVATCGAPATATTSGTDTANAANTDTYVSEIYVPANVSSAGVALFNGTTQNGNVTIYLADLAGNQILHTASTATTGATSYQRIPWTATPSTIVGPGTYYLFFQNSATSNSWRTAPVGNCGTVLHTGDTYGTFPTIVPPTTFVANVGPIASLY